MNKSLGRFAKPIAGIAGLVGGGAALYKFLSSSCSKKEGCKTAPKDKKPSDKKPGNKLVHDPIAEGSHFISKVANEAKANIGAVTKDANKAAGKLVDKATDKAGKALDAIEKGTKTKSK